MARLRHRKARLVRKVRCPNYTGFFIDLSNTPQSLNPQGLQPHFQNRSYPLIINTRKNTPKIPIFAPFSDAFFFDFSPLANSWWFFSNARFRVSHSRNKNRVVALLGFSRLGFLWELVIREERFWNFYCGVVTRRHSFGFSRNNMKGALYHWRNPMGAERQKGKIFNFSFLALSGLRDEVPNVLRFLNEIEKRLNAPSNFDGSAGDNL